MKFRQASNWCKRTLEVDKPAYANKTKESITFRKLGSRDFWRIANSVFNKDKCAIPSLFNAPEVLSSASDKAELFAEKVSKNSYQDSKIFLQNTSGRLLLYKIFFCYQLRNFNFETNCKLRCCLRFVMVHKFQWPQTDLNCEPLTLIIVT